MASPKRNKTLLVDQETLSALSLCQAGLLKPVVKLSGQKELQEVEKKDRYNTHSLFPFTLMPHGEQNEKTLLSAKKGESLSLFCDAKICGEIVVDEVFAVNREQRLLEIMGSDIESASAKEVYNKLGDYALSGDYKIFDISNFSNLSQQIQQKRQILNAKKTAAIAIQARPLTRIHERIFRLALDENDLLVIFLLRPYGKEFFDFEIRKKTLEYLTKKFLPKERILILPLDETYILHGSNKILIEALIAQNLGCDTFIIGANHPHMAAYYENGQIHTIFDNHKEITINKRIINRYVYCFGCKTIVTDSTCPHGRNRHINYEAHFLQELLKIGIPPPSILMRKEISAILLSHLYPDRLSGLRSVETTWLDQDGIIKEHTQEEIYSKIIDLCNIPILY